MMGKRAASRLVIVSGTSEAFWRGEERRLLSSGVILASEGWTLMRTGRPYSSTRSKPQFNLVPQGVPSFGNSRLCLEAVPSAKGAAQSPWGETLDPTVVQLRIFSPPGRTSGVGGMAREKSYGREGYDSQGVE